MRDYFLQVEGNGADHRSASGDESAVAIARSCLGDRIAPTHENAQNSRMIPVILCLIVLAMPFAIAAFAAFAASAVRRPVSAQSYRLNATAGDGVADIDDDCTLYQ
jgi:hypothetical protein